MSEQKTTEKNNGKNKRKSIVIKVVIVVIVLIVLIGIPLIIDRFLAHEVYLVWCRRFDVESPMKVGEWFGFLGSYLGVVGTIIVGIVAYRQAYTINEQNENYNRLQEKIAEMQKEITDFQLHPIIYIRDTSIKFAWDVTKQLSIQQEIEDYYFCIYGKQSTGSKNQYILLNISFDDKGIMPTVQYEIMDFEWKIADNNYQIKLNEFKRKIDAYDKITILIDDSDTISDKDTFFENLDKHINYASNGFYGYDKSILKLKIRFINQKVGNDKTYNIIYRVRSGVNELKPGDPFLKSE